MAKRLFKTNHIIVLSTAVTVIYALVQLVSFIFFGKFLLGNFFDNIIISNIAIFFATFLSLTMLDFILFFSLITSLVSGIYSIYRRITKW